jgi:hypothetical protein
MARKASMWAKEAGEYYRKNVGKNGIESFTDVLKSSDFKKEYYAKNGKAGAKGSRKRGGDGDAVNATTAPATTSAVATSSAPTNTTGGEIQVPMENIMGVMKTGGMKMGEMKMKKGKSMKKKGKMTKKRSLKNKKNRRLTKKYMGGDIKDDILIIINNLTDDNFKDNKELINKLNEYKKDFNINNINTINDLKIALNNVEPLEKVKVQENTNAQPESQVNKEKENLENTKEINNKLRCFQETDKSGNPI